MDPLFPIGGLTYTYQSYPGSTSTGKSITTGGTANVKTAWTEMVAAAPFAVAGLLLEFASDSTGVTLLYDLGIGAAGSETVLLANLHFGTNGYIGHGYYVIPISIASGTRLAARVQSSGTSDTCRLNLTLLQAPGSYSPPTAMQTYGAATGDSGGTSIDPGGTANTKGSYVQLSASLSANARLILLAIGNNADNTRTGGYWKLDLATGPAGSETILIPDLLIACTSNTDVLVPTVLGPFPVSIASGTRLAARASCTFTTAGDRLFDLIAYTLN
jgi:hypothetical protein